MEYVVGVFVGIAMLGIAQIIFGIIDKRKDARVQRRVQASRENYEKIEKIINSLPPYKFAVNRDEKGWRWEVLYLYVARGMTYYYKPLDNTYGHEQTKQAAIEAGRARCEELTNIKKWKEEREVYSL